MKTSICSLINILSSRYLTWFSFVYVGFWQPFDEDYLNHLEPPVKHMSFHAYIRKLTGGADKYETCSVSLGDLFIDDGTKCGITKGLFTGQNKFTSNSSKVITYKLIWKMGGKSENFTVIFLI